MRAFTFSIGVIVLSGVAVILFVLTGGSWIFYVFALLAIALGFYMAWHISQAPAQTPAKSTRKKSRKQ